MQEKLTVAAYAITAILAIIAGYDSLRHGLR